MSTSKLRGSAWFLMLIMSIMTALPLAAQESLPPEAQANPLSAITDYLNGPEAYILLQDTHVILGYTSAALGVLACILNPGLVDDDLHGALGSAAAVTSAMNIGVGLLNYSDRIFSGAGFSSDTLHAAMGVTGSILMIAAAVGDGGIHPWLGGIGAGLMSASILLEL